MINKRKTSKSKDRTSSNKARHKASLKPLKRCLVWQLTTKAIQFICMRAIQKHWAIITTVQKSLLKDFPSMKLMMREFYLIMSPLRSKISMIRQKMFSIRFFLLRLQLLVQLRSKLDSIWRMGQRLVRKKAKKLKTTLFLKYLLTIKR